MEHLTGGTVKAGYHEVVIVDSTLDVSLITYQCQKKETLNQTPEFNLTNYPPHPGHDSSILQIPTPLENLFNTLLPHRL